MTNEERAVVPAYLQRHLAGEQTATEMLKLAGDIVISDGVAETQALRDLIGERRACVIGNATLQEYMRVPETLKKLNELHDAYVLAREKLGYRPS